MWSVTFDKDEYHNVKQMREWCNKNLSQTQLYLNSVDMDANIRILYNFGQTTFYFKSKEEYNWFMLRWG